jgi:hypothetical protein
MSAHVLAFALQLLAALDLGPALREPTLAGELHQLVARSGFGRMDVEVAAFLVRSDGELSLVPWAATRRFREQQFHGVIPSGTIAIVHTHPLALPDPSPGDRRESERLGMPIVVLTPRSIVIARPSGADEVIVRGYFWSKAPRQP